MPIEIFKMMSVIMIVVNVFVINFIYDKIAERYYISMLGGFATLAILLILVTIIFYKKGLVGSFFLQMIWAGVMEHLSQLGIIEHGSKGERSKRTLGGLLAAGMFLLHFLFVSVFFLPEKISYWETYKLFVIDRYN